MCVCVCVCISSHSWISIQLCCGFRKLEGLDWWWLRGQLKSLLSPPPGSGLRGSDFLILTMNPKFLSHSSLHETHAFLHCAEWPPMKYLTSEVHVTEVSNPIYFILTAWFHWTRDSFLSLYSSHFMVPWNSAREIIPQILDILETQVHFSQAPKMSELPLRFLSPVLSWAQPLLHCLPLLSSLPDSIFFFFFGSVQALKTWPLLFVVPSRQLPGLHWPLLISKVLCVSSCFLNNASRSQSGADRPRAGYLSWRFSLLTWVSFDIWGRLWLSSRFWASLMCSPYSDLMGSMCLLYSRGTKWRNIPLASHI